MAVIFTIETQAMRLMAGVITPVINMSVQLDKVPDELNMAIYSKYQTHMNQKKQSNDQRKKERRK